MIVQMIGHVLADTTVNIGRWCSCVCPHGCIRSIVDMYLCVTHVGVEFVYDTCADAIATHLVVYGAMHLCV